MRNQAVSSARNQPCSPLHLFSFLTYAKYGWQSTDIAPPAWHLCATLLCAWKVRFSCLENLLHRAEFCVRSSTLEIDCELHTLISWAMERRPLPSLPYYLTVLVQDLCYSDPLSSVLTISDPIVVRDDLSLACSSLSLCMPRHASMRLSCNKTDRTSLPSHGAAGLSTSPRIAPTHAHRPVRQPNSLAKAWPCSLDSGLRPRAQTPLLVLSRHTFSAFWL